VALESDWPGYSQASIVSTILAGGGARMATSLDMPMIEVARKRAAELLEKAHEAA
jgi:hypothetical protein